MKQHLDRRHLALSRPRTIALLEHLLIQRSPTRVRDACERLSLPVRDFGLALRTLERHGLAKRLRLGSPASGRSTLNPHLFVEATELARSMRAARDEPTPQSLEA